MLPLKLWKGELYLHYDRISKKKDSILVYTKEENTKNIVAHLDNFLLKYEKKFTSINEKINTKTAIVNRCLADYKPQIKAVYYYNKAFLVQLEWNDEDDNQDVFDTYFTIPESVLEKSLEKLLKK